jgi:hypothetical protein
MASTPGQVPSGGGTATSSASGASGSGFGFIVLIPAFSFVSSCSRFVNSFFTFRQQSAEYGFIVNAKEAIGGANCVERKSHFAAT